MISILLFRTDRVGDFLLSLSLIKNIKKNHPNSKITIVASQQNFDYIKSFDEVDHVINLNNNIVSKIILIFKLRSINYDWIIVHDGKSRSKFISYFLKYKKRVVCINNLIDSQYDIIRNTCDKLNLTFDKDCLNFLDKRKNKSIKIPFNEYIQLHFDEKWIYDLYNKKYNKIEPTLDQLASFIDKLLLKSKNVIITTGSRKLKILDKVDELFKDKNVKIIQNQNLQDLECIVFDANLLITCHGWISHIASAKKIKQVDIIDQSYPYNKWTSHFRNYNSVYRKSFNILSEEILKLV